MELYKKLCHDLTSTFSILTLYRGMNERLRLKNNSKTTDR